MTVGVLGGVGPLATVSFMQRVIDLTQASTDQDHVDMIVWQHASIPDRTAYLLGRSTDNPLPVMIDDARRLEAAGVALLAMPCNTAHFFYDQIAASIAIPLLNIVSEAVDAAIGRVGRLTRLGVLATDGTVATGTYERACQARGLEALTPEPDVQSEVMDIIYHGVKAGRPVARQRLAGVVDHLRQRGCQAVVLGCTELSVLGHQHGTDDDVVDSLDVLARVTIERSGRAVVRDQVGG